MHPRSQQTVERILGAASELLAQSGLDGFNTNAIAARADVSVATLYGYFADKFAILRELSDRIELLRDEYLAERFAQLPESPDWRSWAEASIDGLAQFRVEYPDGNELRTAMVSIPEFRALQREHDDRRVENLAATIRSVAGDLRPANARAMARVILIANVHVLDQACEDGGIDRRLVEAHKAMVIAFLATVMD